MRSVLLIAFLFGWPLIAMSQTNNPTQKSRAEIMRELRLRILTSSATQLGLKPSGEYPRVCTALMDWPLGTNVISVYGCRTGDASIYSTSTFGVIGGIGHETVRNAAQKLVKIAESHYEEAVPTKDFSLPKSGHIYFYLVSFDDVRRIDVTEEDLRTGKARCVDLGNSAQKLMTELRLIAEAKP